MNEIHNEHPTIGEVIKTARRRRGYNQRELARRAALSLQTIGECERGNSNPSIEAIRKICDVLGLDLLIGDSIDVIKIGPKR